MMLEKLLEAITGLTTAINALLAVQGSESPKARKGKASPDVGAAVADTATPGSPAGTPTNAASAATAGQSSVGAVSEADTKKAAQDAGNAMVRVANEIHRDKAVEILSKYGAATFAGIKPADYAAFKADCEAALKPAAPSGAAGLM